MKRNLVRILGGVLIVVTMLAYVGRDLNIPYFGLTIPLFDSFERIIYDARLNAFATRLRATTGVKDPRLVILDIDQKSLAERQPGGGGGEGHWPWPRDRMALLL